MSVQAPPTIIDRARMAKSHDLKVQLTKFDPFGGVTEANVQSQSSPGQVYNCSMTMNPPRSSCTCEDFKRTLKSCKHLAAMVALSARLWGGVSMKDFV